MKVKVTKPGTVVWDAEQGVVVQDTPIAVRATGAIRDALNNKQIIEVFDEEVIIDNSTTRPEANQDVSIGQVNPDEVLPIEPVKSEETVVIDEAKPDEAVSVDEAPKAKKLTVK